MAKCGECLTLPASRLRHRVTLQDPPASTVDANGHPTGDWSDVVDLWCSIEPLTGRELWHALQVQPQITHRVEMRYRSGVSAKQRLLFGSRVLNIASVRNIEERNITLELSCIEET